MLFMLLALVLCVCLFLIATDIGCVFGCLLFHADLLGFVTNFLVV